MILSQIFDNNILDLVKKRTYKNNYLEKSKKQ